MGSNNGLRSVIICVLLLGLVLGQVQVEGKSCCKTTTARNCYNVCRFTGASRLACANICGCTITSGTTCPNDLRKMLLLLDSSEVPDATKYCNLGCRSSVCDNMNHETKIDEELCRNACASFCNGDAVVNASAEE
ncbi:hypothetical protein BRADI_1g57400v3 [Brachypodium distachyon]|uniref:Uncharacterized protein n=1 Tax=Brachypodium distachyon TaxID=15368 RepID=A0A2K2DS17_BRADI|nr:hypothetical protein BRADI_1g57400v3 [Brachypodium distachyon]